MAPWIEHAAVYHLYPLGTCGAPWKNPRSAPVSRFRQLESWIDHAAHLGTNTVLFGPFWESDSHGYDTCDYTKLDNRLGTNDDLKEVLSAWKRRGFRVVLDGVFHHCGRGFEAFQDVQKNGRNSPYARWFSGLDFDKPNALGDAFSYDGWNGHLSLVKFRLDEPAVREHLFSAVAEWIDLYDIDGLRLDAADVMDKNFQRDLAEFCRKKKPDFWLMGEVIHGNYTEWAPGAGLDSVTNYELYKGLWSSLNDANFFELAWTLNRQFGPEGLYRGQLFSSFGDNHDVERIASILKNPEDLRLHAILQGFAPGVPTIYYGSESGILGKKGDGDEGLRPALDPEILKKAPWPAGVGVWQQIFDLRRIFPLLRTGNYTQAHVGHRQIAFWRGDTDHATAGILVAVNSDDGACELSLPGSDGKVQELLGWGAEATQSHGRIGVKIPRKSAALVRIGDF